MKNIKIEQISQIFLFFDYDGHACKHKFGDDQIEKLIQTFDNETLFGKIYISYPMVEAIKDLKKTDVCSRRCIVKGKENINYKKLVADETDFQDLRRLTLEDWHYIIYVRIISEKYIH